MVPPSDWRFVASPRARAFLDELAAFEGVGAIEPTAGFKAELRPYQKVGLAWMDFLRRYGFGGVLADYMKAQVHATMSAAQLEALAGVAGASASTGGAAWYSTASPWVSRSRAALVAAYIKARTGRTSV